MNHSGNETMDALVWTGARAMRYERVMRPTPEPGDALIEVAAVGICGSEISGYLGHSSLRKPPLIMGHETVGRVAADCDASLADGSPATAGRRVVLNPLETCGVCDRCRAQLPNLCRRRRLLGAHRPGAFAQFVAIRAALCTPIPDSFSDAVAIWVEPLACAVRALHHTALAPGSTLLVIGAGPIGLCCVAAASAAGLTTLVIDRDEARLAAALAWGAGRTLSTAQLADAGGIAALAPGGVDAAIDAVGATVTRGQAVEAVVPGGRAVFIGLHEEQSVLAANYLVRQEITVAGSFAYTPADFASAIDMASTMPHLEDWLNIRPLDAGPDAFATLATGTSGAVKIVLVPPR